MHLLVFISVVMYLIADALNITNDIVTQKNLRSLASNDIRLKKTNMKPKYSNNNLFIYID